METALDWLSEGKIENYMGKHQDDENANELWIYFQNVINRVKTIFPNYRKEMRGVNRGRLYATFKDQSWGNFEAEITKLMQDEDVTKKS